MRKTLTAGIALVAVVALAGCASSETSSGGSSDGKHYTMTLIQGTKGSPFYKTMACGAQEAATKNGVSLSVSAPDQFDPALQTPVINAVTAKHPDAALVVPVDREALNQPLTQMKHAGIKIVEVDQRVSDDSLSVSKIASNDKAGGRLAADRLAKLIGEKGSVLVITAPPGSSAQDARTAAFEDQLKKYPNITYVGAQYQVNDVAKSASIVTSSVAAHPDLAGIFSTNDVGAIGAVTGLKEAGKVGDVKLVAYDAAEAEVKGLNDGAIQALIAQDPYLEGQTAVEQALLALNGGKPEAVVDTPLVALTSADPDAVKKYTYKSSC
jgi:ribose transport system substrate-binding protein